MSRTSEIITISLPPQIAKKFKKTARMENKTQSELFRAAFSDYADNKKRWDYIRKAGDRTAKSLRIKNDSDIERLIDSLRK
jgi:predicted transcriptional regulator